MIGNKSRNNFTDSIFMMIRSIEMPSNVESIGLATLAHN